MLITDLYEVTDAWLESFSVAVQASPKLASVRLSGTCVCVHRGTCDMRARVCVCVYLRGCAVALGMTDAGLLTFSAAVKASTSITSVTLSGPCECVLYFRL